MQNTTIYEVWQNLKVDWIRKYLVKTKIFLPLSALALPKYKTSTDTAEYDFVFNKNLKKNENELLLVGSRCPMIEASERTKQQWEILKTNFVYWSVLQYVYCE